MPVVQDDLWRNPGNPGMIVVTSHAAVDRSGRLFMDYGAAREALRRIPEIDRQCGEKVRAAVMDGFYGFLLVRPPRPEERIIGFGLFQTRYHWKEDPDPELIKHSMESLRCFIQDHNNFKIRMNFPGISQLPVEEVTPLLVPVPPQVTLCHQGEVQTNVPDSFPGFKAIYHQVEAMLKEGRNDDAVEYLVENGFDLQSAMDQVAAVQRMQRERLEREAERLRHWRNSSHYIS